MKKVLIVGAGSYIGESFAEYAKGIFKIVVLDAVGLNPEVEHFKGFNVVLFVAGIVHRKETPSLVPMYYQVNRDLAVAVAAKAKKAGVAQFILLSSMSVYGMLEGSIVKATVPHPITHYGKSKLEADQIIERLSSNGFRVAIVRPPMVYGKNCKGNYQALRKLALITPVFPRVNNRRSMLYIGNLCAFLEQIILSGEGGLFFPQNGAYVNTSELVNKIAVTNGKTTCLVPILGLDKLPFNTVQKLFGTLIYRGPDCVEKYGFEESVAMTEGHLN